MAAPSSGNFWFYRDDEDQEIGPVAAAALRELYRQGQITGQTLVRQEGSRKWTRAGKLIKAAQSKVQTAGKASGGDGEQQASPGMSPKVLGGLVGAGLAGFILVLWFAGVFQGRPKEIANDRKGLEENKAQVDLPKEQDGPQAQTKQAAELEFIPFGKGKREVDGLWRDPHSLRKIPCGVWALAFAPDSKRLFVFGESPRDLPKGRAGMLALQHYDLPSGTMRRLHQLEFLPAIGGWSIMAAAASPQGNYVAVRRYLNEGKDQTMEVWDFQSGNRTELFTGPFVFGPGFYTELHFPRRS